MVNLGGRSYGSMMAGGENRIFTILTSIRTAQLLLDFTQSLAGKSMPVP
jgi:hypothetical protein